jgi:acetyl esterase
MLQRVSILSKPADVAGSLAGSVAGSVVGTVVGPTIAAAEKVTFCTTMGLPDAVLRRLAGKPIERDGQTLAPDVQLMLKLAALTGPGAETQPIAKGRAILRRQSVVAGGDQRIGRSESLWVAGLPARLYTPTFVDSSTPGPLLVFLHGGGFIFGDLDSHDAAVRFLAEQSGVRVLSVDYRLAPEYPFPAAYDDALAAFRWTVAHAETLGIDPTRIGVGGDSAGGNLAAEVALAVGEACAFQLLIYPVTAGVGETTTSRELFGRGFYLTDEFIALAVTHQLVPGTDPRDPRLAPLHASIPPGTAPAYLCTAGFDPLRDEGHAYADKLAEAGVPVEAECFPDQIHGFFNTLLVRSSKAACRQVAAALKAGLLD